MVETKVDVLRPPSITLSQKELDEIDAQMAAGVLPPDYLDRHLDAVEANVFGHDHKKDRHGDPIEQGIGSPGNQTQNSVNAYRKYAKYEMGFSEAQFAENLKRMEGELAASNEARAAAGTVRRRRGKR